MNSVNKFLSGYDAAVAEKALLIREIILNHLPGIIEQVDLPAKMIAYSYGPKYADMICTLIPSKKGLKLGFYKGNELPDPDNILEGSGKISRYVQIRDEDQVKSPAVRELILNAYAAYKKRTEK